MTDKQTLLAFRLKQAEETLSDAEKMLQSGMSTRSIINRAYYAVFYSILALFLHGDISLKTSKHSGVLAIFDKEFVHTGKLEKKFSKIAHRLFDARQQVDYKELIEIPIEEARECVELAKDFGQVTRQFMEKP
jgi:uncharacterized protein (UPF0332 family)